MLKNSEYTITVKQECAEWIFNDFFCGTNLKNTKPILDVFYNCEARYSDTSHIDCHRYTGQLAVHLAGIRDNCIDARPVCEPAAKDIII